MRLTRRHSRDADTVDGLGYGPARPLIPGAIKRCHACDNGPLSSMGAAALDSPRDEGRAQVANAALRSRLPVFRSKHFPQIPPRVGIIATSYLFRSAFDHNMPAALAAFRT